MTDKIVGIEIAGWTTKDWNAGGLENDELENDGSRQYGFTLRCLEYIMLTASVLL